MFGKTLPGPTNSSESCRRSPSKSAPARQYVLTNINTAYTCCDQLSYEWLQRPNYRASSVRALFKEMATRGGTVLGLALSWGLACITQCSSTDKGHVSTCWGESSLETKLEPWNIQIEYINWERMKLDMLKKLRLYRKLDYNY